MIVNASSIEMCAASIEELKQVAVRGQLFAILDACDAAQVPSKAIELGPEQAVCLYNGRAKRDFWGFAPYLAVCDEVLVDWIHETLWDHPWGIFVESNADLEALRKHFRKFLLVENPQGKQVYFRYYDPRVLKSFLPVCNTEEVREMFGPVNRYALNTSAQDLIWMGAR